MIDRPDSADPAPLYRARAARRARRTIASGAALALLSAAVFAVLLRIATAEDRDGFLLAVLAAGVLAGLWGVWNGVATLRRNRAG